MDRTIIKADNSQISTFLRCPTEWYYTYVRNIEALQRDRTALDKGTVTHALLDVYYKKLAFSNSPWDAYKETLQVFQGSQPATSLPIEDIQFIKQRFFNYVTKYSQQDWIPLVVAGRPQVEIGFSIPLVDNNMFLFVIEGRLDLITNTETIVDHKSQSRRHDYFAYDTQWLTYCVATGLKQLSVNYFGLQEKLNEDTFRRQMFTFSNEILERYKQRMIAIFYKMAHSLTTNTFEMNEGSCTGKFGHPCQFAVINGSATGPCYTLNPSLKEKLINIYYKERVPWQPWTLSEEHL